MSNCNEKIGAENKIRRLSMIEQMTPFPGAVLDREKYEEMLKEFYELRDWDIETGLQKAETLERIGLSDLVKVI